MNEMVIQHQGSSRGAMEELYGPVLTLHSVADGTVFFTIGNQVFSADTSGGVSACSCSHSVCRIENGDTIIALSSSAVRAENSSSSYHKKPITLIFSAADTLFWYTLPTHSDGITKDCSVIEKSTGLPPIANTVCSMKGDRIIRIRYVVEHDAFLIMSASAAVYWMTMSDDTWSSRKMESAGSANQASSSINFSPSFRLIKMSGPATLGVTLAVDACVVDTNPFGSEKRPLLHTFSGTYSGSICEWVKPRGSITMIPITDDKQRVLVDIEDQNTVEPSRICSLVPAHGPSCAIFAVQCFTSVWNNADGASNEEQKEKVLNNDANEGILFTVASCSDDRTAAVFRRFVPYHVLSSLCSSTSSSILPPAWQCVWRGGGSHFSLSRVFDVSIFPLDDSCCSEPVTQFHGSTLLVGVASEDGGVQLLQINSAFEENQTADHGATTLLWHHTSQHSGHGATKVHIGCIMSSAMVSPTGKAPCSPFIVSAGFDGTVLARAVDPSLLVSSIPHSRNVGAVAQLHNQRLSVVSNGVSTKNNSRDRVRCVVVTDDLHILVCTEQHLWVTSALGESVQSAAICAPLLYPFSPESDNKGGVTEQKDRIGDVEHVSNRQKTQVTTAVSLQCRMDKEETEYKKTVEPNGWRCYSAVLGTVSGEVLVVPYRVRFSSSAQDAEEHRNNKAIELNGPVLRSNALRVHGKCLIMEKVGELGAAQRPCVVTSHVDQSIILSRIIGSNSNLGGGYTMMKVAVFGDGPGVQTTALKALPLYYSDALCDVLIAVGDRTGMLKVWRVNVKCDFVEPNNDSETPSCLTPIKPIAAVQVFSKGSGIATVYPLDNDGGDDNHPAKSNVSSFSRVSYLLTNHDGSYCVWSLASLSSDEKHSAERGSDVSLLPPASSTSCTTYCPHRLYGIDNCASVLFASSAVWISVCGTTASVHTVIPGQLRTKVREIRDVRAPRLLHANVTRKLGVACLAHCSDGENIEIVVASVLPDRKDSKGGNTVQSIGAFPFAVQPTASSRLSSSSMCVLYGAQMPGKDFNCCCYFPILSSGASIFDNCVLCGNEDSSLIVHSPGMTATLPARATISSSTPAVLSRTGEAFPTLLRGPHHSNILAVCSLDTSAAVSVGGFSTVVLWHFQKTLHCSALGQWTVCAVYTSGSSSSSPSPHQHPSRARGMAVEMGSGGERVPRFLGVCRLAEDSVAVASSDATIKYFRFLPTAAHPDTVLRSVLLEGEVELDPEAPRPVFCISPVPFCATPNECDVALTVSGDAGGRIFVVERMRRVHALEAAVIAQCKVEDCAVNAISSVHQRGGDEQRAAYYQTEDEKGLRSTWEVAAITDSGTVHLLSITLRWGIINSGGEQRYHTISCMVAPLFRYSIGITAGRGIVWNSLQDHIIAACEERVVRFCRVFHSEGKEQDKSNNTMRLLQSVRERRSNIRSISGICARAVDSVIVENIKPHHHGYEVVVVGQGVEVLYI